MADANVVISALELVNPPVSQRDARKGEKWGRLFC